MSKYMALYIAALNLTIVVTAQGQYYRMRGLVKGNPLQIDATTLCDIDGEVVNDLINQTLYGFVPVFKVGAEWIAGSLSLVNELAVSYAANGSFEYDDLIFSKISVTDSPDGDQTTGEAGLQYYVQTAYVEGADVDTEVALSHFGEHLLSLPTTYENFPLNAVVQLIGSGGNLALGVVVAKQRFGTLIAIDSIAKWTNTQQSYEVRSTSTTRVLPCPGLKPVDRGMYEEYENGQPINYADPLYDTSMHYGVALQPAPGYKYALSQLELQEVEKGYIPRANANFEFVEATGKWTPSSARRLAENFAGNISHNLDRLLNCVGAYTLKIGDAEIQVTNGTVSVDTVAVGPVSIENPVLKDENAIDQL